MANKQINIDFVGCCLEVETIDALNPNVPERYFAHAIKSVVPLYQAGIGARQPDNQRQTTYPYDDRKQIVINFFDENGTSPLTIDLEAVANQAGWTLDLAGLNQACVDICTWITNCISASGGGGGGLATEATLSAVLTAVQNHQDFEIKLVRDNGNSDQVVCQRTEYDETTNTYSYSYVDVNGAVYVPVGPIEYIDPEQALNLVIAELQTLNTRFAPVSRTPGKILSSGVGAVAAGARAVTIFNKGGASGTVLGVAIDPGESNTWSAGGEDDTLGAIAYDGTGTTLVITTVV